MIAAFANLKMFRLIINLKVLLSEIPAMFHSVCKSVTILNDYRIWYTLQVSLANETIVFQ